MKQVISILLVFTVNLLFLTHALLPHHHHDGIPHFIFSTEAHHNHGSGEEGCCCPASEAPCGEDCALDQDIEAICANDDEDCHCALCCVSHDHEALYLLQAILFLHHHDFSLPDKAQEIRQPSYVINHYSEYIAQTLGMRAPPVV